MKCEWCNGKGYMMVEANSSLSYCCQDCNGSGIESEEEECDECGKLKDVEDDCEHCEEDKVI